MSPGDYKEVLLKYISPDQLPEAYGGTRCEPDPYCTKYVSRANSNVGLKGVYIYISLVNGESLYRLILEEMFPRNTTCLTSWREVKRRWREW